MLSLLVANTGILSSNPRFMLTHAPLCARGTNALPSSWFCLPSTNSFCSAHAQACLGTHGACIFCNSHTLHVQHFFFCTKISHICRGPDMNFYIQSSLGEKCVKCNSWGWYCVHYVELLRYLTAIIIALCNKSSTAGLFLWMEAGWLIYGRAPACSLDGWLDLSSALIADACPRAPGLHCLIPSCCGALQSHRPQEHLHPS